MVVYYGDFGEIVKKFGTAIKSIPAARFKIKAKQSPTGKPINILDIAKAASAPMAPVAPAPVVKSDTIFGLPKTAVLLGIAGLGAAYLLLKRR